MDDLTSEERELLGNSGGSLAELGADHADCPSLEILQAARAGVLPEDVAQSVAEHVEKCRFCQILRKDLTADELSDPNPDEALRVRQRVFAAVQEAKAAKASRGLLGLWFWKAIPATVLSAVAVAFFVWWRVHPTVQPHAAPAPVTQQKTGPSSPSVLAWEKLPIKLQAGSILVMRGEPRTEQEKYAAKLTAALAFYRDENYAEAAKALADVTKDFPRGIEGQLYLGISQLKLNDAEGALASLTAAQKLDGEQFRDDANWYLALAYRGSGDVQSALTALQKLCEGKSRYAERACAGMRELEKPPGNR